MQKHYTTVIALLLAVIAGLWAYSQVRSPRARYSTGAAGNDAVKADLQRALGAAKVAVAEYYASNAQWPADNAAAGLPAADTFRGESLRRLEVAGNTITLTFDQRSGVDGGRLVLTGDVSNPVMGPGWTCTSPDLDYIASVVPNCSYTARP